MIVCCMWRTIPRIFEFNWWEWKLNPFVMEHRDRRMPASTTTTTNASSNNTQANKDQSERRMEWMNESIYQECRHFVEQKKQINSSVGIERVNGWRRLRLHVNRDDSLLLVAVHNKMRMRMRMRMRTTQNGRPLEMRQNGNRSMKGMPMPVYRWYRWIKF